MPSLGWMLAAFAGVGLSAGLANHLRMSMAATDDALAGWRESYETSRRERAERCIQVTLATLAGAAHAEYLRRQARYWRGEP